MAMKRYNHTKIAPKNIHDCLYVVIDNYNNISGFIPTFTPSIASLDNENWYKFLKTIVTNYQRGNYYIATGDEDIEINVLQDHIFKNYSYRSFLSSLFDLIDVNNWQWNLQNFIDRTTDMNILDDEIIERCKSLFIKNQYKYKKLFDAMTLEFNPLWNVDGTETTTRTLEKDGTISNARDGYDELVNSGHDDTTKSGKDYNIKSGSENTRRLGDDDTTYSGKEETKRNGDKTLTTEGGEITTHEEATTDSQSLITTTKDNTFYGVEGEVGELGSSKRETETYTNLKDEKTFTDREDSIHHDVTDTTTYNNVRDEMNFDSGVETEYHSTHRTTHDVDDVQTFDTIDTERITLERRGNIGVTKSTDLLESLWNLGILTDFVDAVAKDIVNVLCEGVY